MSVVQVYGAYFMAAWAARACIAAAGMFSVYNVLVAVSVVRDPVRRRGWTWWYWAVSGINMLCLVASGAVLYLSFHVPHVTVWCTSPPGAEK